MYRLLYIFGTIIILMCSPTIVLASDTQVPEGYKVVTGDEGGSLSDAFRGVKEQNNANIDQKIMEKADKKISTFAGTLTSAIIYLIFALTGFTTACDLLYIGVPFLRPYLYDGGFGGVKNGQADALVEGMRTDGYEWANRLDGRGMRYQARANDAYARGDTFAGNMYQDWANQDFRGAQHSRAEQTASNQRRAIENQQSIQNAQNRAESRARGGY